MDRTGVDLRAFLSSENTEEELRRVLAHLADTACYIKRRIGQGIRGRHGTKNIFGEDQLELDVWADHKIAKRLEDETSFGLLEIASEEQGEIKPIGNKGGHSGRYSATVDPLDGSSLADVDLSIGTIFGIHKGKILDGRSAREKMAAAMYVVYGPYTVLALSTGRGTHEFMLDDAWRWILTREGVRMGERGIATEEGDSKTYGPGGLENEWTPQHSEFIGQLRKEGYKPRYSGALVADVHHVIMKGGGIFTYPGLVKKPQGKLRLLFEEQPLSFLAENAGGRGTNGLVNILDVVPERLDQRSPFYIGSKYEVELAADYQRRAA